ncbi:MAG: mechanosensitive ion channel family protein [Polyangiaceae bacterium]|nr:mechanosensitive ion channel family protein [Polyangiaceae bacterium]
MQEAPLRSMVMSEAPKTALTLFFLLVLVAYLVGRFAPAERRRIRSGIALLVLYVGMAGLSLLADALGEPSAARHLFAVGVLFEHCLGVLLAAVLVFHLLLTRARVEIPDIARDVTVGAGYAVAVGALLHRFGVQVPSLLASGAVATLVLGLSLQATLGNVIGGLALQLDGSIREGDWIRLPDKTEGKVVSIRWRHTVIETRNWDSAIVPNAQLLAQNILILGQRDAAAAPHRMWVYFDVDYRTSPDRVIEVVEAALRAAPIPCVAADPPPNCVCLALAADGHASVARYAVRYYLTDLARDDPTSSVILSRVFSSLSRAEIPLGIPAAALFVEDRTEKRELRKVEREIARRAEVLAGLDLFRTLTDDERHDLARRLRVTPFAAGEIITRQGAVAHWLYVLARGSADVRVRTADGDEGVVATVVAPTIFGEQGLMTGERRNATVVASGEVLCLRLDKEDFREFILARPEMADEISRVLAERQLAHDQGARAIDEQSSADRMSIEQGRMLTAVQRFFGLSEEPTKRG